MIQVGQAPVCLKKEIDGFALNRVQAAIIAESWRLVQVSVRVVLRWWSVVSVLSANHLLFFFNVRPIKLVSDRAHDWLVTRGSHTRTGDLKSQINEFIL